MPDVRTLRRGEAVALSSLTAGRRSPEELVVSVTAGCDVVALQVGADGRVGSDLDLVFFNQPSSPGGAVRVEAGAARARVRPAAVEERVARVLIGCAGGPLDLGRDSTLRVDLAWSDGRVVATAAVDVPASHRAETLLEVYRWGTGWRVRLLGEGYAGGLEAMVRDHGVHVDDTEPAPPLAAVRPTTPTSQPSPGAGAWWPESLPAPVPAPAPWGTPSVAPTRPATPSATRRRRRPLLLVGGAAAVLVIGVAAGAALSGGAPDTASRAVAATSSSVPSSASASSTVTSAAPVVLPAAAVAVVPAAAAAQADLALLPVKGRAPMTGYDRAQFGQAWADVDRNGCDTRNDVLRRDVTDAVIDPTTRGCVVLSGTVADPYSGRTVPFTRGADTSADLQVDHVVALGDAWQTGAQQLDATRREQFANDPANLRVVDGALNAQKGDGDAATWLPPNVAFRCTYVAQQVAVKKAYGLWVTGAERDAIARVLATCPGATTPPTPTTAVPTPTTAAPAPVATTPVAPPPAADPGGSVFYKNCDAVRAAGKAPLYAGQPGYSRKLDRDGDGIACE